MPAATNATRSSLVTHSGSGGGASNTLAEGTSPAVPEGNERCPIGATIRCTVQSAGSVTYEGEVLAYDPKEVLVIKCPSSSGRTSLFNVHMVNLSLPCEWKILSEKKDTIADPPSLNVARLHNRQRDQVERKKKQIMAFKIGVSPMGQQVFQAISKTIDDLSWSGQNITVLKEVTIYPPYRPEDVRGNMDSKALKHVRKIVEKYISDQQQSPTTAAAATAAAAVAQSPVQQSRTSPIGSSSHRSASSDQHPEASKHPGPAGRGTGGKTPHQARFSAAGGNVTGNSRSNNRESTDSHHSPHRNQHHHHPAKPPFSQ